MLTSEEAPSSVLPRNFLIRKCNPFVLSDLVFCATQGRMGPGYKVSKHKPLGDLVHTL